MKTKGIQLKASDDAIEGVDLLINPTRGADGRIISGLTIGNTMEQNKAMLLIANPGAYKSNPTIGVAIDELLFDKDYLRMQSRITEHFKKDNLVVRTIQLEEGQPLVIEASYEK